MTLTEIHMIAEIFGSVFLVVSAAIIIFELHQNLKQRKIQNTFMRAVEDEKTYYKNMEKDFAILVVKAQRSFSELEEHEKHQFLSYVRIGASIFNRRLSYGPRFPVWPKEKPFDEQIKRACSPSFRTRRNTRGCACPQRKRYA